ncbi:exodeoxyribonuclease III [Ginsengibacter hankyongi]|uniref:Exodeoxyribonuclease III n=1 Tax=Ginsengibacter hankyongi TaxID=2607284 RepID=A0A5J5IP05_9BACT|nr:exodeoxyribonuclease III [Ginsengibacter hankyongi]KAA9041684.1 exodeoxyribonuclease III [Ginsengibacter hankyongi]
MRIITYNVNGIRAAIKRGFIDWLKTDPADIVCIQEVKAHEADIDRVAIESAGYRPYFFLAQKKGYSGVGILTKIEPTNVEYGHGKEQSDFEGRVLRADFGDITLINAYFPSGTTGEPRQSYKYIWLDEFLDYLNELRKTRTKIIVCGDYNIAHKDIDIHNPVSNKKTSGFLPEERAWLDKFMNNDFVDGFRHLNKEPDHYTWWSVMRPSTRLENKGWRIDYINVSTSLRDMIKDVKIFPEVKHSDHCPVYLELKP